MQLNNSASTPPRPQCITHSTAGPQDSPALTPLSTIVEILYAVAYSLIAATILTSLTSGADYKAAGTYTAILAPAVAVSALGYGILAVSHAVEAWSITAAPPQLMPIAEALPPRWWPWGRG